jgi:hypothetical protein
MAAGYVYVLANSSMPGLVKVGKTTRLPSERADELSGVTGVATPFIVVYEEHFEDCDAVEAHVHTALSAKGLRLSENREFFRAAVSDVVKTLVSVKSSEGRTATDELSGLLTSDNADFDSFRLDEYRTGNPWDGLMDEAIKHQYGTDGYIQDYSEAMKLYRDASRLGSKNAYLFMGDMYRDGNGVPKNQQNALDCYKEGAKRGNYLCYAPIAKIFILNNHAENAHKALAKFISNGEADGWKMASGSQIHEIKLTLLPSYGVNVVDSELLSIAHAYLPQLRDALNADLGPCGMASTYPKLKPQIRALLVAVESHLNRGI